MSWPEWLTEARIALAVSLISAIFTGGGLLYTRRLAKNDTARMARKLPIVEAAFSRRDAPEGWNSCQLTIRNQEPVSIRLLTVAVRRRGVLVALESDARTPGEHPWETGPLMTHPPGKSRIDLGWTVAPEGKKYRPDSAGPFDTVHIYLITKGATSAKDFRFEWEWADGQKP